MSCLIGPIQRQEPLQEEGILFVRTESILQTMGKLPLILAGLILVSVVMPFQNSFSSTRSLDLVIYQDGSTHIFSEEEVDPLEPEFELKLFGNAVDNLVIVSENGFLLSNEVLEDVAIVETFGTSLITINYDAHDLVSKEGRIWTFIIDSPISYSLLLPQNSVIVGMNNIPLNLETINDQSRLSLPSGYTQIDYISSLPLSTIDPPSNTQESNDNEYLIVIVAGIAAAILVGTFIARKSKKTSTKQVGKKTELEKPIDIETIFRAEPDLREDDKQIIKFIVQNGGQALESELRKKFLQPRTTMWRAVKRLERYDIVEIEKKDLQNLVKLKTKLEEEK